MQIINFGSVTNSPEVMAHVVAVLPLPKNSVRWHRLLATIRIVFHVLEDGEGTT